MKHKGPDKNDESVATEHIDSFASALGKIAKAGAASSRAAIEAIRILRVWKESRMTTRKMVPTFIR
jgi:hypothetical protein